MIKSGFLLKAKSKLNSLNTNPLYATSKLGNNSKPSKRARVSGLVWGSIYPTTTSNPIAIAECAASNIAYVFPTPAAYPKKILSFPLLLSFSFLFISFNIFCGLGRVSLIYNPPILVIYHLKQD